MIRILLVATALALTACGNNGVMDEIERAEQNEAQAMQQGLDALNTAVQEEAQALPAGLQLQFVRRGHDQSLAQPTMNANALVHYAGSLADNGEEFDSSFARGEPAEFPLRGVVPGFSEAITHMRPGDEVIATFPGSLGYGPEGRGPIPPDAALRFRIVLLAFQEPGGEPVQAEAQ